MNNAKLLTDILIAAAALATPFLHAKPTAEAAGLSGFLAPRRAVARHVSKAKVRIKHKLTYTVTATAYQAVANQTDSEPFITADNSHIKPHYGSKKRWMALSRDLLKPWGGPFNYGDKVRVSGISPKLDGVYTVHDTMNCRHRHCMDVLTHVSEKFDIFQPGVKIQLVERKREIAKL
jgi:3D (Asp-Asp-Asp) domain-containing protein